MERPSVKWQTSRAGGGGGDFRIRLRNQSETTDKSGRFDDESL
jgi:hypothetical protein